jgi:hypothetical protein
MREAATAAAHTLDEQPDAIDHALALGERMLAAAEAFAFSFELPPLGDIDLPPDAVGSEEDRARLQGAAPLYLAAELEAACLLPAAEAVAALFAGGGLQTDLGPAAPLLVEFWRGRKERFSAGERQAFFARLFGHAGGPTLAGPGGVNSSFEPLMIALTEALTSRAGPASFGSPYAPHLNNPFAPSFAPPFAGEYQLRQAARQLGANLALRGGGITAYAARDILGTVRSALEIFKQPMLQRALGAGSVWGAVRAASQLYLEAGGEQIGAHVTRGKWGLLVLSWLSEVYLLLGDTSRAVAPPEHPVVGAALTWLQASLSIEEVRARATPAPGARGV